MSTTVGLTGDQNIDALLKGIRWAGGTVSFGFTSVAADYGGAAYLGSWDPDGGGPLPAVTWNETTTGLAMLNPVQTSVTIAAFAAIQQFTNLAFAWDFTTPGATDIRAAMTAAPDPRTDADSIAGIQSTAYAYEPGPGRGGDIWFNATDYLNPLVGTYAYQTIFHEIGHALGLKHGHAADTVPGGNSTVHTADRNALEFSTMTYSSFVGDTTFDRYNLSDGQYPQSYMMYDIAALQHMYGADFSDDSSSTYRFGPADGTTYLNDIPISDPAQFGSPPSTTNVIFRTIWDGGGYDAYDFTLYNSTYDMDIDLSPGGWTDVDRDGNRQAAFLGGGGNARGQIFNALLFNGDTRSLIEHVMAGAGDDRITGNDADNLLQGNNGNDSLDGGWGNDRLEQGRGGGDMSGGPGDDTLVSGDGADTLNGGGDQRDRADYGSSTGGVIVDTFGLAAFGYASGDVLFNISDLGGSRFADVLYTGELGNRINGRSGNDELGGRGGDDSLYGEGDNDTLIGGLGTDLLSGGTGFDIAAFNAAVTLNLGTKVHFGEANGDTFRSIEGFRGGGESDTMFAHTTGVLFLGGGGLDFLYGGAAADTLSGESDGDFIQGRGGNDELWGGDGNDSMRGGDGVDTLNGGTGVDIADYFGATAGITMRLITGGTGGEAAGDVFILMEDVRGSSHADAIAGDDGANRLRGLANNDTLEGGLGADTLEGSTGDDLLGADNDDLVRGGTGYDRVIAEPQTNSGGFHFTVAGTLVESVEGREGSDRIDGGGQTVPLTLGGHGGADTLTGGNANDGLYGGAGNDYMFGAAGFDEMLGGEGDDTLIGGGPASLPWGDRLQGGAGNDSIVGSGNGILVGDLGNDTIRGADNDAALGHDGADRLIGGAGHQQLIGGAGNDTLVGGTGNDRFDFDDGWGADIITDFEIGLDQLGMFDVDGLDDFGDLDIDDVTGGALITIAGISDRILLAGVLAGDVTSASVLL